MSSRPVKRQRELQRETSVASRYCVRPLEGGYSSTERRGVERRSEVRENRSGNGSDRVRPAEGWSGCSGEEDHDERSHRGSSSVRYHANNPSGESFASCDRRRVGRRDLYRSSRAPSGGSSSDDSDWRVAVSRRGPLGRGKQIAARKWIKPDKFDGSTPLATFLGQMRTCAEYNRWSEDDKLAHLRISLKGTAAELLSADGTEYTSYEQLVDKLKQRYGTEGQLTLYRTQLRTRRRGKDESLQSLYLDISRLARLAYPGRHSEHGDSVEVDAFIDALQDSKLELRIRDREPKDLDTAFRTALMLEANSRSRQPTSFDDDHSNNRFQHKIRAVASGEQSNENRDYSVESDVETDDDVREWMQELKSTVKELSVRVDELGNRQVSEPVPVLDRVVKRGGSCFKCGDEGHWADRCPARNTAVSGRDGPAHAFTGQPRKTVLCFNCRLEGHIARNCPNRTSRVSAGSGDTANFARRLRYNDSLTRAENPVYLNLRFRNDSWKCLLDTGCEVSLVPSELMRGVKIRPSAERVFAVDCSSIPIVGEAEIELCIGGLRLRTLVLVSDKVSEPILGIDWLKEHRCVWDFSDDSIRIHGRKFRLCAGVHTVVCRRITRVTNPYASFGRAARQVVQRADLDGWWRSKDTASWRKKRFVMPFKDFDSTPRPDVPAPEDNTNVRTIKRRDLETPLTRMAVRMTHEENAATEGVKQPAADETIVSATLGIRSGRGGGSRHRGLWRRCCTADVRKQI